MQLFRSSFEQAYVPPMVLHFAVTKWPLTVTESASHDWMKFDAIAWPAMARAKTLAVVIFIFPVSWFVSPLLLACVDLICGGSLLPKKKNAAEVRCVGNLSR